MYELQRQIGLILSQAKPDSTFYEPADFTSALLKLTTLKQEPPLVAARGSAKMSNEQVLLLRRLYASCSPELQGLFPTVLTSPTITSNAAKVTAHILVDIRSLPLIREMAKGDTPLRVWYYFCEALIERIANESHSIVAADLDEIERIAAALRRVGYAAVQRVAEKRRKIRADDTQYGRSLAGLAEKLQDAVTLVRYLRLKAELLEAANAEINADEQVLLGRIESLGFGRDLEDTLHEIERKAHLATTPADFKTCMDFCRSFLEEFLERAAKRAEPKLRKPIPTTAAKSHFQPWRQYLTHAGIMSDDESELLQKLYNYVSNAGSHALGATSEHARVTKNMVIELTMLIAGRVESVLK